MKIVFVQIRLIKIYGIVNLQTCCIKIPSSKQVLNPRKSNFILTLAAIDGPPPIFVLQVHLCVKEIYEILDISKHWGWLYNIPYKMILAFLSKRWNFLKTPKTIYHLKQGEDCFFILFMNFKWLTTNVQILISREKGEHQLMM